MINQSLGKKGIKYLGVCANTTQTACNWDYSNYDVVLLILVKSGHIIGSTIGIHIQGVGAYDIIAKYSGVEYQGIAWRSGNIITSCMVSNNSVAMHVYAIKF